MPAWALVAVVVLAAFASGVLVARALERRRLRELAGRVNAWLGAAGYAPLTPRQSQVAELAVALNAVGASHARLEQRLRRARQLRIELVDALPDPALLFDGDGRLVRANAAAGAYFGAPRDEPLSAAQALGSHQLAAVTSEARDQGRAVRAELVFDGRELSALAAPVGEEILLVVTDQTGRRRVDAVRRDFVANASHELKTPVSGIQALADALEVTIARDPDRARDLARRLRDEAERLGRLVRHLLDLRRLEEEVAPGHGAVDLVELVVGEVDRIRPAAEARGIDVRTELPARAVVGGTEGDLRLVVANLLDNAVAYNRPGGRVTVTLAPEDGAWSLTVADTGIGIARDDLDRVFERFYRVDVARSRATGGTGLGLAIVRHAVERHGGSVTVESVLGEGSTFRVRLPVEPAA